MKNQNTYTFKNISDYLKHFRYLPTYRKGNKDAFYNPRNQQNLLVPIDKPEFSKVEIVQLFIESRATDMPPDIEFYRFKIFMHSQNNNY